MIKNETKNNKRKHWRIFKLKNELQPSAEKIKERGYHTMIYKHSLPDKSEALICAARSENATERPHEANHLVVYKRRPG